MGTDNLAPDDPDAAGFVMSRACSQSLCLVDIGTSFAKVVVNLVFGCDSLDSQKSSWLILISVASFVACENSLAVQPAGLLGGGNLSLWLGHDVRMESEDTSNLITILTFLTLLDVII